MLVANDWQGLNSDISHISDETATDPLGNVYRRRSSQGAEALAENQYPVYTR